MFIVGQKLANLEVDKKVWLSALCDLKKAKELGATRLNTLRPIINHACGDISRVTAEKDNDIVVAQIIGEEELLIYCVMEPEERYTTVPIDTIIDRIDERIKKGE